MRNDKDNIIVNKTVEFSLAIINYCEVLEQKKKLVIAKQLFRSATSIGANVLRRRMQKTKQTSFIG